MGCRRSRAGATDPTSGDKSTGREQKQRLSQLAPARASPLPSTDPPGTATRQTVHGGTGEEWRDWGSGVPTLPWVTPWGGTLGWRSTGLVPESCRDPRRGPALTGQAEAGLVEVPHAPVSRGGPGGRIGQGCPRLFFPSMHDHGHVPQVRGAIHTPQLQTLPGGKEKAERASAGGAPRCGGQRAVDGAWGEQHGGAPWCERG